MKVFKDSKAREWTVAITVASLARIKDLAGIDLTELTKGDPPAGVRLTTEPLLVGQVLAAVVRPQLDAAKVATDDFLEALDGDAYALGFAAIAEELIGFFQKSGRPEQATALQAQMKVLIAATNRAKQRIESLDLEKMIDLAMTETAGTPGESSRSATSSAASSASTPGPSRSASSSG